MVFSIVYNSTHTFCLDLILLCNLLQFSGTRCVLTNVSKISDVQNGFPPYTGVKVPNLDMSCGNDPTYFVLKNVSPILNFITPGPAKTSLWLDFPMVQGKCTWKWRPP